MSDASPVVSGPYGPMTPQVRQFLMQFAGLGASSRARIVARYQSLSAHPSFALAEQALAETITRAGRIAEQEALAGPLLQLVRRASPSTAAATDDTRHANTDEPVTFDDIAEPALAAVLALLVADLLLPSVAATLYAPMADEIVWPR